ncbi:MAG: hypothetical protein R3304_13435 [Longimicrobiales bacterium]|nr:hypothetical protein [Longimicrobiales bacterium]
MKRLLHAVVTVGLLLLPYPAAGQLGVAARVGSLGIGAEAAVGLSDRLVARGGIGLVPLELSTSFDGVDVDLELPDSWYNVGLDLYLNGALRVGGGLLIRPDDPTVTGAFQDPVDIGGRTFTPEEIGTLTGTLATEGRAPYLLVGFGKHTDTGFGLSLDVGVVFSGNPDVTLDARDGIFSDQAELEIRLQQEAQDFEDDMKGYLRFWPIASLGLRLGVG